MVRVIDAADVSCVQVRHDAGAYAVAVVRNYRSSSESRVVPLSVLDQNNHRRMLLHCRNNCH